MAVEGTAEREPGFREDKEVGKEKGERERDKGEVSDRSNLDYMSSERESDGRRDREVHCP